LIEPWDLKVCISQDTKESLQDISLASEKFLNMNFTHGMAMQLQEIKTRILEKTFKINEESLKTQNTHSSVSLR
jgi:hypothetical protein